MDNVKMVTMNRSFNQMLFDPRTDKYNLLANVKVDATIDTFSKKIRPYLQNPLMGKIIDASAIIKDVKDLRKTRLVPYTENLQGEIAWYIYSIKKYDRELNLFLANKQKFENAFLLNKYHDAREILKAVEQEATLSIWQIENSFLLNEYEVGVEANWEMLSNLSKQTQDPFVLYYLEKLSKRAEKKFSYFRYRSSIQNELSDFDSDLRDYLYFRLIYIGAFNYENFHFYLNRESNTPIIDRYEFLIQVIHELVAIEVVSSTNEFLIDAIDELHAIFAQDTRLKQFHNLLTAEGALDDRATFDFIELCDRYTKGDFEYCIKEIPQRLSSYPSTVEYYEIYIKSLIEKEAKYIPTDVSKNIDTILDHLFNIYTRNEKNTESTGEIARVVNAFLSANWGRQMLSILSSLSNLKSSNNSHALFYISHSNIHNPRALDILKLNDLLYNRWVKSFSQNYLTLSVINWINTGEVVNIEQSEVYEGKKSLYIARAYLGQKNFSKAIEYYRVTLSKTYSVLIEDECVSSLFRCYIQVSDFASATALYTNSFLKNKHLVLRLDKTGLLDLIERNGYGDLEGEIDLPIFYRLASIDTYKQYVAYDVFLSFYGVTRPSGLFIHSEKFSREKLIYFLTEVCKPEILNHSVYFDGPEHIDNERLDILKYLMYNDSVNESKYIKELTEVTQSIAIRNVIRQVNKGRVTINVAELKNSESEVIKEEFLRFQELGKYSKEKDWIAFDIAAQKLSEYFKSDEKIKVVHVKDPAFISFRSMFLGIRDKYLLSKEYGLDGYLSTRIRHGTLLNHIRSVFESFNLISQKDSSGQYLENEYWNDKTPWQIPVKLEAIQNALKKFSKRIDDLTESIIKDFIQVKTEKFTDKQKAFFDYTYNQDQLAHEFIFTRDMIKDFNTFIDYVFKILEERTVGLLEVVRAKFNQEIKEEYFQTISDLHNEVKLILGENVFSDLTFAITKSSTNIQNELHSISEWFSLSDSSSDIILDIESLIQTGVQITNNIYPSRQIHPKILINKNFSLKGAIHIYDIIRILLNNIVSHADLDSSMLDVRIGADLTEDKILRLSFTNNVSDHVSLTTLDDKLRVIKNKWEKEKGSIENINIEGGSGFDKIKKILVFDMGRETIIFDYNIKGKSLTITVGFEIN